MLLKADIQNIIKPFKRPKSVAAWVDLFIFNRELSKKAKLTSAGIAVGTIALFGMQTFWLLASPPELPTLTRTNIKPLEEAQVPSLYDFYKPEYQSLFGSTESATQNETGLDIKLTGVITGTNPVAIIKQDKTTKMYKTGDKVTSGVVLKQVYADHIIINNSGKEERLSLPQMLKPVAFKGKGTVVAKSKKINWLHEKAATDSISAEVLRADVVAELTDAANLMSMAKFYELRTAGIFQGFVLQKVRNDSLIHKIGLRNNDEILALDGLPFKDRGQVIAKLLSFHQAETATIKIRRRGETINLVVNII